MLNDDYKDMLCEFGTAGVEYMVIGAFAMAAHGYPRATGDLDLWVRATPANAGRVMQALVAFGAPLSDVTAGDFIKDDMVLQIGVEPRRIDICTGISGVQFDDAWPARIIADLDDVKVPVVGRQHLLTNKRAVDRPKDRIDVRTLERKATRRG